MSETASRPRFHMLDALRGLCVVSMVLYHAMYDVVNILGHPVSWFQDWPGYLWQQSVCWTFILLSGFCWGLSRHHRRRGVLLVLCGGAVSLVTSLVMPQEAIHCGILTLLGLSTLLLWGLSLALERLQLRIPAPVGLAGSALLFFLCRGVPQRYLGFEGLHLLELPQSLYRFDFLAVLGFPSPAFLSSDYFPLLPWFFLFLTGHFLRQVLEKSPGVGRFLQRDWAILRPFRFLGMHSLLIYLAHQPVLMAVFWALSLIK